MRRTKKAPPPRPGAGSRHRDTALRVLMQFRQAANSAKRHFRWIGDQCGVSGVHVWALWELSQAPGASVSDVARALAIHQSTASNLLDRLTRAGLLRRERGRADQRVSRLFVTPAGAALLRRAPSPVRAMLLQALVDLSDADLRQLETLLARLLAHMKVDRSAATRPLD